MIYYLHLYSLNKYLFLNKIKKIINKILYKINFVDGLTKMFTCLQSLYEN